MDATPTLTDICVMLGYRVERDDLLMGYWVEDEFYGDREFMLAGLIPELLEEHDGRSS